MTRSGTEADIVIMCQKIGYVFLTIKSGDFGLGFALIDCRTSARKTMAHPGKAGTGLRSSRLEPVGQSPPYSGNDPLRDGRSGRQEADGALRPGARGRVGCGAPPRIQGGGDAEAPGLKHDDRDHQRGGKSWRAVGIP